MKAIFSTLLFLSFIVFSFSQSDSTRQQKVDSLKVSTIVKQNTESSLTNKEKYVLKMLRQGYSTKSIELQTNMSKGRIKEIKKDYLK
ncbi:MAG: hypothetical protein ACJ0QL_03290 [Parvicellaceae bacterium]|jgi:DNA-binding NarL/FixJ family response regulator